MRKIAFLALAVCFAASWVLAQEAAPVAMTVTLTGEIIDNMCAEANKDNLEEFMKTHTKDCALMCASSGYLLVSEGKMYTLDEMSNKKVEEFLKLPESKLEVEVTALETGDKLNIISIKNQ